MTLLLLLLLVISGRVLAAPCAMDSPGHDAKPAAEMQPAHCSAGDHHCDQQGGHDHNPNSADCDRGCNCCPGHCAAALAGDPPADAAVGRTVANTYSDLNSDPSPEGMIRPPQSR